MTTKGVTVLYVEDSDFFREKTSQLLKAIGFNVITANDGREAIEILEKKKKQCDLILSDILMPHVDGLGLAKYNYRNALLPFVVYTSLNETRTALKFLKYGVHDYLEKPFQADKLVSVIKNALNRWSMHKEREEGGGNFAGNLHSISFSTKKGNLVHANKWVMDKIHKCFDEYDCDRFMNFFDELLLNAYEHGNLNLSEAGKSKLILEDSLDEEINRLEKACDKKIIVELSFLSSHIAVKISDEGEGFDYEKYLFMSEDDILEKLNQPNGRGLLMAKSYFDVLRFSNNGTTVFLSKKIH